MDTRRQVWILFAAIALGVAGIMRAFDAIWAFRYSGALPENLNGALLGDSLTTYGWVHLILAAILIVCAVLIVRGSQSARWVGVVAAGVEVITAMWWMPYWPTWSLVHVALGMVVIYALVIHAGPAEDTAS